MKLTIPILMLLTMTMSFSKGMMWLGYELNKDFITRNLCINKSKPELQCKGKCQLMKKMEEEEKKGTSAPFQKIKMGFSESELPHYANLTVFVKEIQTEHTKFYRHSSYTQPVFPVFHPPA